MPWRWRERCTTGVIRPDAPVGCDAPRGLFVGRLWRPCAVSGFAALAALQPGCQGADVLAGRSAGRNVSQTTLRLCHHRMMGGAQPPRRLRHTKRVRRRGALIYAPFRLFCQTSSRSLVHPLGSIPNRQTSSRSVVRPSGFVNVVSTRRGAKAVRRRTEIYRRSFEVRIQP